MSIVLLHVQTGGLTTATSMRALGVSSWRARSSTRFYESVGAYRGFPPFPSALRDLDTRQPLSTTGYYRSATRQPPDGRLLADQ